MNCAYHAERTATAFCQNCGKALCPECIRAADGLLLCDPCLQARYPGVPSTANPGAGWTEVGGTEPAYRAVPPPGAGLFAPARTPGAATSPFLAGLLGLMPGVGAMYNGQFIKALIHVVIFMVLVGTAQHFDLALLLVAAWVFYQVFDAAQTASARRDGRPLPDPFGILDLSRRLGPQGAPVYHPPYPTAPPPASPPPAARGAWTAPPTTPYSVPYTPVRPVSAVVPPSVPARRGEPVGAIVLIAVGLLLLMSTLGVLDVDWIGRGWPVLIMVLGIWLLVRRAAAPLPGEPSPPPRPNPASSPGHNPLSLRPDPPAQPVDRSEINRPGEDQR